MSDSVPIDVSAVMTSEEVPQVESSSEVVVEEVEETAPAPDPVTTEEVVENVKEMLTSDPPVKSSTEERLNALIELLKGTSTLDEYDDDMYRWAGPLVSIREKLNEL